MAYGHQLLALPDPRTPRRGRGSRVIYLALRASRGVAMSRFKPTNNQPFEDGSLSLILGRSRLLF